MKDDEQRFLIDVYKRCAKSDLHNPFRYNLFTLSNRVTPRDLINEPDFYMHHKRAWRMLEKWAGKGWYNWGVTLDLGWLEDAGKQKAQELINNETTRDTE